MENPIYTYAGLFLGSGLFVYFLTPFVIRFALWTGFVDSPAAHKAHTKTTPLLGGLAVAAGFFLFTLYAVTILPGMRFDRSILGYLGAAMILVVLGLIDDKLRLSPLIKLIGQIVAVLVFLLSNNTAGALFNMLGPSWVTVPVLMLWMLTLINALNFLDNMDGIITGMSGILALGFYALSFMSCTEPLSELCSFNAMLSLIFAGSMFGFLPHNYNPAKVFLGDTGSMLTGYFLSTMGFLSGRVAVLRHNDSFFYLAPMLLLSYALFDISLVTITRHRDGRRVTQGGKDHSTHRINNVTGSPKITALIVYLINSAVGMTTLLVYRTGSRTLLLIVFVIFLGIYLFLARKLNQIPIFVPQNQLRKPEGQ
jgi:UDP-GlcNAc:undecaprenyl-phosphate/decaprenyl-phosphate GlcNAc-1-phosphate transferase